MKQCQGPAADSNTFFWSSSIFGRKMLRKSPKCQGTHAMYIRPGNNMVGKRNHLLYHFSITIHLHLAGFHAQNTSKKNYLGKMLIQQIIEFQLRGA